MAYERYINAVLDRLRSNLGLGETPVGSNSNFIVTWYNQNVARIGNGPWCEMTDTWAMWTGGAKSLKVGRAYTVTACQDAVRGANGSSWHWDTAGMMAGDQVYYDWSGRKGNITVVDHTGTVEKIIGDGTFYVLEGNASDRLVRMRRDRKFVVGYVRFDWKRLSNANAPVVPTKKLPPARQSADRGLTRWIQILLEVSGDGKWGKQTDHRAIQLRNASRARFGYPRKINAPFNVREVQGVVNTTVDGKWGPKSDASLRAWIIRLQRTIGVKPDGSWGPITDNAFVKVRARNLNNY